MEEEEALIMSTGGWIFPVVSWGITALFVAYCFTRIFTRR